MSQPKILMLNGTCAVGKSTTAKALQESEGFAWVHPDGLWDDTPTVDQRELTFRSVEFALDKHPEENIIVIDQQFQHQFMIDAFQEFGVQVGKQILLYCSTSVGKVRLTERAYHPAHIKELEAWADWLYKDSKQAGNLMINSSRNSVNQVVELIVNHINSWGWRDA